MQIEGKREDAKNIPRARIAILHAEYYLDAIERMVEACVDVLGPTGCEKPDIFSVPGCVELPLAARRIARLGKGYEAIICFGVGGFSAECEQSSFSGGSSGNRA